MADNVEITAGTGTAIATDDIGSAHYQRVKLALGADGAYDMDLDSGQQTKANSVPVAVASNQTGYATPTHSTLGVTTSTQAALASNANRIYALLVNDSDTTIYIKLGADAVANQGIRLNASGGSYEISAMFGNLYTGAINAIHGGTGTKTLLILEGA